MPAPHTLRPLPPRVLVQLTRVAKRPFASVAVAPNCERIVVPCRSNGSVTLDIFHSSHAAAPTILYLPSGPVVPNQSDRQESVISALAAASGATIACINYRLSQEHPFPRPVHDVLTGYDWVLENLPRRNVLDTVGVCGELVGGSLATMLALTESRKGGRRVGAAAVNNPIADWVFADDLPAQTLAELLEPNAPEETSFPADGDLMGLGTEQDENKVEKKPRKRSKRPSKAKHPISSWLAHGNNAILSTSTLSSARKVSFRRQEDYFDRFASPVHFFRSPHGKLIYPQHEDVHTSRSPSETPETIEDFDARMSISHFAAMESNELDSLPPPPHSPELPTLVRCRAYARLYPSANTNLSLPLFHITAGSESPLLDQAAELTKLLKRGITRQTLKSRTGRTQWHDAEEKIKYEDFASQMVHLKTTAGVGLWTAVDSNPTWREDVEEVGSWMKESLKS